MSPDIILILHYLGYTVQDLLVVAIESQKAWSQIDSREKLHIVPLNIIS